MQDEQDVPPLKKIPSTEILGFHEDDVNYYMNQVKKMSLEQMYENAPAILALHHRLASLKGYTPPFNPKVQGISLSESLAKPNAYDPQQVIYRFNKIMERWHECFILCQKTSKPVNSRIGKFQATKKEKEDQHSPKFLSKILSSVSNFGFSFLKQKSEKTSSLPKKSEQILNELGEQSELLFPQKVDNQEDKDRQINKEQ